MTSVSPFEKYAWILPEPVSGIVPLLCNAKSIKARDLEGGKRGQEIKHQMKDLIDTVYAVGAYVVATHFYPGASLPVAGCLVSQLSPDATRWGTGTYVLLTSLKGAWSAWKGNRIDQAVKNVAFAALGYLATTPVPIILKGKMISWMGSIFFGKDGKGARIV